MNNGYENVAIVIPSLEPTQTLISYVKSLISQGFINIYIINDGSSSKYDCIFNQLEDLNECNVLTHQENKGKGAALKTAYNYVLNNFPSCTGVITADSDGQHSIKDVCKVAKELLNNTQGLIIGSRDFSSGNIPLKSWIGNRFSSLLFLILNGKWLQDTQTGLRGFNSNLLNEMSSIEGDRFEYEMAVLSHCASKKIEIHNIFIQTIYLDGNSGTHFNSVSDSILVMRALFSKIIRFIMSSGISALIDTALCWNLFYLLSFVISSDFLRIGTSVVLARIVSMIVNYTINKKYVFKDTSFSKKSFVRYLSLAITNIAISTISIYIAQQYLRIDERIAKFIIDITLFIINYEVQRIWVFHKEEPNE